MENLNLEEEEEEDAFQEEAIETEDEFQFFLVDSCLIDSVVYFPSVGNTMAGL